MIKIEDIPAEKINEFWNLHIRYLVEDGIISDEEEIACFTGNEYRGILEEHMIRSTDKQHMVYFCQDGIRIGAASYCTNQSEDENVSFWITGFSRSIGETERDIAA